jgi:RNA polymerase sigma factor (sigma-70 family)
MSTEQQFVALVRRHRNIVYKVYNLYCHKSYPEEDYYQDVIMGAWSSFPNFRGDAKFSTWLYKISRNVAIDRLRRVTNAIRTVSYDNIFYQIQAEVVYDETEKLAKITQFMQENRARYLISQLSRDEQELVILYASGKSYDEMEAILGIDKSHLRVKMHRIKARLSKKFGSSMSMDDYID